MPRKKIGIHPPKDKHELPLGAGSMIRLALKDGEFNLVATSLSASVFFDDLIHLFQCPEPKCTKEREELEKVLYNKDTILALLKEWKRNIALLRKGLKEIAVANPRARRSIRQLMDTLFFEPF